MKVRIRNNDMKTITPSGAASTTRFRSNLPTILKSDSQERLAFARVMSKKSSLAERNTTLHQGNLKLDSLTSLHSTGPSFPTLNAKKWSNQPDDWQQMMTLKKQLQELKIRNT